MGQFSKEEECVASLFSRSKKVFLRLFSFGQSWYSSLVHFYQVIPSVARCISYYHEVVDLPFTFSSLFPGKCIEMRKSESKVTGWEYLTKEKSDASRISNDKRSLYLFSM